MWGYGWGILSVSYSHFACSISGVTTFAPMRRFGRTNNEGLWHMTRRNKAGALNDTGDLPVYKPVERLWRRSQ